MLRLADLLSLELPDFVNLISDLDFVHDFGAVESMTPTAEQLGRPATSLMQQIKTVEQDCGLLRAYASMLKNNLLDLPVVNKAGELVGIVSRVDIGAAILSSWMKKEAG